MKAITALVFIVLSVPSVAQGPAHLKVEFENDSILVLRIRLDSREKTPMQSRCSAGSLPFHADRDFNLSYAGPFRESFSTF
jgi:hypothetical protein